MIENGMVLEADAYWDKVYGKPDYWEDDRDYGTVEQYGDDRDILYKAVALWLDVDEEDADRDRLDEVYDMMTRDKRKKIVEDYVEFHDLQEDFNDWYSDRYCDDVDDHYDRDYDLEHGWRD